MSNSPRIDLPFVPEGTLDPAAGLNLTIVELDALVQTEVLNMNLTAPPGAPVDGQLHIVNGPATGAWAGHEGDLAQYIAEGTFWKFYTAGVDVFYVLNRADGTFYFYEVGSSPPVWTPIAGGGGGSQPVVFQMSASDLMNPIAAGANKAYMRAPQAMTITEIRASLLTASSSGAVTVDINVNGSTILSTKLTIDQSETTSETAATAPVITDPGIDDDDEIRVDIDGAGTGAVGLIVTVIGDPA